MGVRISKWSKWVAVPAIVWAMLGAGSPDTQAETHKPNPGEYQIIVEYPAGDRFRASKVVMGAADSLFHVTLPSKNPPCTISLPDQFPPGELFEAIRLLSLIPTKGVTQCRAASFRQPTHIRWLSAQRNQFGEVTVDSPCMARRPGVRRTLALAELAITRAMQMDLCDQ